MFWRIGFYANGEVYKDWQGGQKVGFVDNEKIFEEWRGGKQLGAVVNGGIYRDWSGGSYIGNAKDYTIHGLEHNEPVMAACWHFLISKIF